MASACVKKQRLQAMRIDAESGERVSDFNPNKASADGTFFSPNSEFPNNGAVYIYDRTRQRIFQKDRCPRKYEFQQGAAFGASVANSGSGEYVMVGAPLQDASADADRSAGAVYSYHKHRASVDQHAIWNKRVDQRAIWNKRQ